jgi:sulfite reductase (ferredoxin)
VSAGSIVPKETKAQRIERWKRAKNPWEFRHEIDQFAREGRAAIPEEWMQVYFRLWGVYTQGDGRGVFGKANEYFMLRLRIPNGLLDSRQLRAIAGVTERYTRGQADITVRQNIQLHWVRIEDLPEIMTTLAAVGISPMGTCGDDTRNITGCPLAGLDAREITDASPLVEAATKALVGNAEFYNLPRKFKITITGCRNWCSYPETNDVGLTALRHGAEVGYSLRVGGGLSTNPHFGLRLNAFVVPEQVVDVLRGVASIFRDADVLRQDRAKARLKFLFLEHGWTAESFQRELESRIGFRLAPAAPETPPPDHEGRDHLGLHAQKQSGLYYAGFAVLRGRISAREMHRLADLSDAYGDGKLRTTGMQNIIVVNIGESGVGRFLEEAAAAGLRLGSEASPFRRGTVACTGTEYCKLAIAETKTFARWLVEELEERLPGFDRLLRINVNGCPNSCGQHWIADIGLQGCTIKQNGQQVDAFDFLLGGGVGAEAGFTRRVGFRATARETPEAIERLLRAYLDQRVGPAESVAQFCRRHSDEELRGFLAGQGPMATETQSHGGGTSLCLCDAVANPLPEPWHG